MLNEIGASLIAYVATKTGMTCPEVFAQSAIMANYKNFAEYDRPYLKRMATAACQTTNPDIIWQIVQQESAFRFLIVRINYNDPHREDKILVGAKDVNHYLTKVKNGTSDRTNVDIGPMQINYHWHGEKFKQDPFIMLDPAQQVYYLAKQFSDILVDKCNKNWLGCYHNMTDTVRARDYRKSVQGQGKKLAKASFALLKGKTLAQFIEEKNEDQKMLKNFNRIKSKKSSYKKDGVEFSQTMKVSDFSAKKEPSNYVMLASENDLPHKKVITSKIAKETEK